MLIAAHTHSLCSLLSLRFTHLSDLVGTSTASSPTSLCISPYTVRLPEIDETDAASVCVFLLNSACLVRDAGQALFTA